MISFAVVLIAYSFKMRNIVLKMNNQNVTNYYACILNPDKITTEKTILIKFFLKMTEKFIANKFYSNFF